MKYVAVIFSLLLIGSAAQAGSTAGYTSASELSAALQDTTVQKIFLNRWITSVSYQDRSTLVVQAKDCAATVVLSFTADVEGIPELSGTFVSRVEGCGEQYSDPSSDPPLALNK